MELRVRLNGTDENPWHKIGLTQNPFPQVARAEYDTAMRQLNSLDADPLHGAADIRRKLSGWSEEFIELCIKQFKPGERVCFIVNIPDQ